MPLRILLVWGIFCQGVWVGRRIFSFVSFFARSEGPFLRLVRSGDDDQRGARLQGADQSRHNLVFGWSKDPNHDAVMRIGAKLRGGGPILCYGVISHAVYRVTATSNRHRLPSQAGRTGPKLVGCLQQLVYYAGRRTTSSGTTPSRTNRHRAIRSLRAKATIMVLRAPRAFSVRARNHCAKALSFWNMRNRHANWIMPRRARALPERASPFSRRFFPLSSGEPVRPA